MLEELLKTLNKLKPTAAKGTYMKSVYISSTMCRVLLWMLNQFHNAKEVAS